MARAQSMILAAVATISSAGTSEAQIDPTKRELVQFGYNQPLEGRAPISGYAFYHRNTPHFYRTNLTLRLAIAPVYMDSELGISEALGPNTDIGLGLAGGGFADTYSEIRQGTYRRHESFTGHGGEISSSLYHLINPGDRIPLYAVVRLAAHYSVYSEDGETDDNFELPSDQPTIHLRGGVRWGGREPLMLADLAMELSAWYEGEYRISPGHYGFNDDRLLHRYSHLFWSRALLAYTMPELKHNFVLSLTGGTSIDADRFSAYRLGGVLPLISEFPLTIPGYFFQEISARSFVLFAGNYNIPLDRRQRWSLGGAAAIAAVDYLDGLEQSGKGHSGVGGGIIYRSPSDSWHVALGYGYGFNAIRNGNRGAHSIGFLLQFDLYRTRARLFDPVDDPNRSRGLQRFFQIFK